MPSDGPELQTLNQPKLERRGHSRVRLAYYLRAFDRGTDALAGYLADIHTEGFRLIGNEALPIGVSFAFSVEVPADKGKPRQVALTARSLWTRANVNPKFRETGFRITEVTSKAKRGIQGLINVYLRA